MASRGGGVGGGGGGGGGGIGVENAKEATIDMPSFVSSMYVDFFLINFDFLCVCFDVKVATFLVGFIGFSVRE